MQVEGILKQQLVNRGSTRVSLPTFGNPLLAIALRINVKTAPRQQDSLHPQQQAGYAVLTLMQGYKNSGDPSRVKGG
jgi:hypothetical protein